MLKKKGVIEVVARNKKGIKIGDEWFGAFKVAQLGGASAGDEVEFEYEQKGDFNNIKGNVKTLGSAPKQEERPADNERETGSASGGSITARDQQIIRQNSLTQANMLLGNFYGGSMGDQGNTPEQAAEEVIAIARIFEQYSKGEV